MARRRILIGLRGLMTFLAIGVCYALVVGWGFFNPAFRGMDRTPTPGG